DLEGLLDRKETALGPRSMPFKKWVEAMQARAGSINWAQAWDQVVGLPSRAELSTVPAVFTPAAGKAATQGIISTAELDAQSTTKLFGDVLKHVDAEPVDLMTAAVMMALSKRAGQEKVVVGVETHGRHTWDDALDISRTQGWFTSIFPIMAKIDASQAGLRCLTSVVDARRKTKLSGIEFGMLQRFGTETADSGLFDVPVVVNFHGRGQSSAQAYFGRVEVEGLQWDNINSHLGSRNRVSVEISGSEKLHISIFGRDDIEFQSTCESLTDFAANIVEALSVLLTAVNSSSKTFFPASKLTLFDWLDDSGLDRLTEKVLPEVHLTTADVQDVAP
ncbi:hypothetical protein CF319_g9663, partial [Tilletia indica]